MIIDLPSTVRTFKNKVREIWNANFAKKSEHLDTEVIDTKEPYKRGKTGNWTWWDEDATPEEVWFLKTE